MTLMNQYSPEEIASITQPAEEKWGLPNGTLARMATIESQGNPVAVSGKGAQGMFQFTPQTADAYGLTDPTDPAAAADAAGHYMADNLKKYGSMDRALADYNGGPKAVAAFDAGTPFEETKGYLVKYHGLTPANDGGIESNLALPSEPSSPDMQGLNTEHQLQQAEHGGMLNGLRDLPGIIGTDFRLNNSVYNYFEQRGLDTVDPNFGWDDENSKVALDGINPAQWDYVLQSTSMGDAMARRQQVLRDQALLDTVSQSPWEAQVLGGVAGALPDIPTLIAFVPGLGGEAMLSATSRLSNAVRMGLVQGGTMAAYEAATDHMRPLASPNDIYTTAALGFGLGALGGAAHSLEGIASARAAEDVRINGRPGVSALLEPENEALQRQMLDRYREGFIEDVDGRGDYALTETGGRVLDPLVYRTPVPEDLADYPAAVHDLPWDGEGPSGEDILSRYPEGGIEEMWDTPRVQAARESLYKAFGEDVGKALEQSGKIRFLESQRDLPESLQDARGVNAVYDPDSDTTHLLADRINDHNVRGIVMHDVGVHQSLERVVGSDFFQHMLGQVDRLAAEGDSAATMAIRRAEASGAAPESVPEEKLAYYLEHVGDTEPSFLRTAIAKAKAFIGKRFGINMDLTKEDMAAIVRGSIRRKALQAEDGEPAGYVWKGGLEGFASRPLLFSKGSADDVSYKVASPGVAPAEATAATRAKLSPVFGFGLGLEDTLGNSTAPEGVQEFARKAFGTTKGYRDHSVVGANAWDQKVSLGESWGARVNRVADGAFKAFERAGGYKVLEHSRALRDFGEQVSNYVRGFEGTYSPEVVRTGSAIRDVLSDVKDHLNNPAKFYGGLKKGLTETDIVDPETGAVTRRGALEENPNYLPRRHDANKWNAMIVQYGRKAVEDFWAAAYRAGRGDWVSREDASKWAQWYVKAVEDAHANRTQDLLEDMGRGVDKEALKVSMMHHGAMTEAEAEHLIEQMFPTKESDAGRPMTALKHRNGIDEKYTERWADKDGNTRTVGLNDFIRTNAFEVLRPYLNRAAATVSLANHLDIYKASDVASTIAKYTENRFGEELVPSATLDKYRNDMRYTLDRIQGIPQDRWSPLNKALSMWRDFNVIRSMGGAVYNHAVESSQIIGSMGLKATMEAVGELKALKRAVETGEAPHEFLEMLENTMGGAGAEHVNRLDFSPDESWTRNAGDTPWNRRLDTFSNGLKRGAAAVIDYTGLMPLRMQQMRVHAIALINHFIREANGADQGFLSKERLAWMGMGEKDTQDVYAALREYTRPAQGEFTKQAFTGDWAKFATESPEEYAKFITAIQRESRRVIRENDLGAMVPIMGSTLGKTMFQFMNYSVQGWNKALMYSLNYRDTSSLMSFLYGGMLGTLIYMGRTMLGAQGMDDETKEKYLAARMDAKQIVANGFAKTAQSSIVPGLFDTISPWPAFSGSRTTSDETGLSSTPTISAINTLVSMRKLATQSESDPITRDDFRKWSKLLPVSNVYPMSFLLNKIASDYPSSSQLSR